MTDVADVVHTAWTFVTATDVAPNLQPELTIDEYVPAGAIGEWPVRMPFLVVHPLSVRDHQVSMGGRYGGQRDLDVQLAFDLYVAVVTQRPDMGQAEAVRLADLVRDKLGADHTWGSDGVTGGGLDISGRWLKDPFDTAAEGLPVLVWRWETPGFDVA